MSTNIDQFSYFEKLATLTRLYLDLSLPVPEALRAAKADLCGRKTGLVIQRDFARKAMYLRDIRRLKVR